MANSDIPSGTNRAELLDDLLALICEFLPDSTLTYVNRAYADYFNTTPDKLLGRRFMDLIPEQYREPLRATYMAATPENPTIRVEHAVWKNGEQAWHSWLDKAIFDEHGHIVRFTALGLDITAQKRSEEAVAAGREREEAILRAIPDMIFIFRGDGTLIDCKTRDESLLIAAPSDFMGKKLQDFLPKDATQIILDTAQKAVKSGNIETAIYSLPIGGVTYLYEARFNRMAEDVILAVVREITEEKRQAAQLAESERRMRAILSALPDLVFVFDRENRYLDYHASIPSMLISSPENFIGRTVKEVLGDELGDRFAALHELIWRTGEMHHIEYSVVIDRQQRYFESYGSPMDEHRILCVVHEITERKEIENQRTKLLAQLTQAQNIANLGSFEYDGKEQKLTWSDQTYRIFGLAPNEFNGTLNEFIQLIHPDDRELLVKVHTHQQASGHAELEHRIIRANDGATRIVHASFTQESDANGQITRLLGVVQDVTDKVEARAERERLLAAIDQAGEGIMLTTPDGTITYVNAAFERNTGYSREETIGRKPSILKSGVLDAAFYKQLWDTILSGKVWTGRFVNRRKDGSIYTEESSISPIFDNDGQIKAFVEVSSDITLQLARDAQLMESQRLESVGRLAGGVAHDYNNMLQIILACAESAMSQVLPQSLVYKELLEITSAATKSATITRQLLTFARQQTAEPRQIDLNISVRGMLNMLGRLIGPGVRLNWQPGEDIWPVLIPPTHVDQILANLCINARDAMPGNEGVITLSTSNISLPASATDQIPGEYVRLSVQDTGTGIPPQILPKIFDPFFSTKELGKGTGLGLPTVYGLVKQASGVIHVSSELGAGTTIQIDFPRDFSKEKPEAPAPTPDETHRRGEKILVVDDEQSVLRVTLNMLNHQGYQAIGTTSSAEALEIARTRQFEVLVTDVMMPGINGAEMARQIKECQPSLKCLFISGYAEAENEQIKMEDETHAFLQKPFSMAALNKKIRHLLSTPPADQGGTRNNE